jgi:hypothetical protein
MSSGDNLTPQPLDSPAANCYPSPDHCRELHVTLSRLVVVLKEIHQVPEDPIGSRRGIEIHHLWPHCQRVAALLGDPLGERTVSMPVGWHMEGEIALREAYPRPR